MGSTITAAPTPIRLVMDAAKVKATTGSRQVPSSTVFSVTQSSRKPNSSARRATVAIVVSVNGSGERCGNDMPRAVLSRNVMGFLVRFFPSACSGLYELPGSRLPEQLAWQAEKCARVVETLERRVVDHENHASPPPHNHESRLADLLRRRLARSPGPGQARARSAAGVWASRASAIARVPAIQPLAGRVLSRGQSLLLNSPIWLAT